MSCDIYHPLLYNLAAENKECMKVKFSGFFQKGKLMHFKKREILIRPDDFPSGVFYIEKGHVKVYSITEDGEEKLHIIYKPDEIFPLIWALRSIQKEAYYEALEDLTVYRISQKDFLDFISSNPGAAFELADRLAAAFDVFIDRVDNLEITKSYPRLVARLIFLAERFGIKEDNGILINAPIAHKDIANSIAMTRETASRELAILEKKGLIKYKNHLIFITDPEKLQSELTTHKKKEPL